VRVKFVAFDIPEMKHGGDRVGMSLIKPFLSGGRRVDQTYQVLDGDDVHGLFVDAQGPASLVIRVRVRVRVSIRVRVRTS